MCLGDGWRDSLYENTCEYYTSSKRLADDFQRLCLHAGWTCDVSLKREKGEILEIKGIETTRNFDAYRMSVIRYPNSLNPIVGGKTTTEELVDFKGMVYCVEVPNHKLFIRNSGTWRSTVVLICNSSRSGQKGMTGIGYHQWDMLFSEKGIVPGLILNPHELRASWLVIAG